MQKIIDGIVYEKFPKGWIVTGTNRYFSNREEVTIVEQIDGCAVVEIQDRAFFGMCFFKITILAPLRWIGEDAFFCCGSLEQVILHKNLRNPITIHTGAFQNCDRLTHFSVHPKIKLVGERHFANCTQLKKIDCSILSVPAHCFENCVSLKEITFFEEIEVHPTAFENSGIEKIIFMRGYFQNTKDIAPYLCDRQITVQCEQNSVVTELAYEGCKIEFLDDIYSLF